MTQVNEMYRRLFTRSKVATSDLLVETTWADLFMKTENGQLIPGQMYRITDYTLVTPESWEFIEGEFVPLESAGKRFDVVVTALSESILSEDAFAMHNKTHDDFNVQDDYISDLSKWALKYSIYNTLSIPFVKRPIYDSSIITDGVRQDDIALVTLSGEDETLMHTERDGSDYVTYHDDTNDVYYYVLKGVTGDETMLVKIPYPTAGETVYSYSEETETFTEQGTIQSIQWQLCPQGKGTIYRMVDEFNNSLPCDFKNLKLGYSEWVQHAVGFEPGEVNTTDFIFSSMPSELSPSTPSKDFTLTGQAQNVYIEASLDGPIHFYHNDTDRLILLRNIHISQINDAFVDIQPSSLIENLQINTVEHIIIATDEGGIRNIKITNSSNIAIYNLSNLIMDGWVLDSIDDMPDPSTINTTATKIAGVWEDCPYIYWKDVALPNESDPQVHVKTYDDRSIDILMVDKGYIYNLDGRFDNGIPNGWLNIIYIPAPLV